MFREYKPSRALRSKDSGQLVQSRVQTKHGEAEERSTYPDVYLLRLFYQKDASVVTCVDFRQLAIPESSAAQTKIAEEKVCRYATCLLLLRILALRSRIFLLSLTASYSALK